MSNDDLKTGSGRNQMLNFLKGIGCIGVVFMHIQFPGMFGTVIHKLAQFAVPVFIMIAGYYAFGCTEKTIKRRLFKMVKIFAYGYAFFVLYHIIFSLKNGNLSEWFYTNFTFQKLLKYIIFCDIEFAIPLWYLIAMIEIYLTWYFVVKYDKEKMTLKMIPVLFLCHIILTTVCETNNYTWHWKINYITSAMPWFLFGYYMHADGEDRIKNLKDVVLLLEAGVGLMIAFIPMVFTTSINFSCMGIIPYATALFMIAIKHPDVSISKSVEYMGDKLSLNIYIFHVLLAGVISLFSKLLFHIDTNGVIYQWMEPAMTIIVSIIWAFILQKCKELLINSRSNIMISQSFKL